MSLKWLHLINIAHVAWMPYILFRYYKSFHLYPIRMWNAPLMLACGIATFFHQVAVVSAQLDPSLTTWAASVPLVVTDSILTDAFILQAFLVYIKFAIVNAQEQCSTNDKAKLQELEQLLHRARWMVSKRFGATFMCANVLLITAMSSGYIALHPAVGFVSANECTNGLYPDCETLVQICMIKTALSWTMALVMAFKLKAVFDSIGIKATLKKITITFLVTYIIYLGVSLRLPTYDGFSMSTMQIMFGYHLVFYFGIEAQVRLAKTNLAAVDASQSVIHQFLLNPVCFDAFFQHAKTEFNVENLSFWKDANALAQRGRKMRRAAAAVLSSNSTTKRFLTKSLSGNAGAAGTATAEGEAGAESIVNIVDDRDVVFAIYDKYIANGAILQINLPDQIFVQLNKDIEQLKKNDADNAIDPCKIYVAAVKSIEKLMNDDMLPRFKKTKVGKQAWGEFEKHIVETTCVSNGDVSLDMDNKSKMQSLGR